MVWEASWLPCLVCLPVQVLDSAEDISERERMDIFNFCSHQLKEQKTTLFQIIGGNHSKKSFAAFNYLLNLFILGRQNMNMNSMT